MTQIRLQKQASQCRLIPTDGKGLGRGELSTCILLTHFTGGNFLEGQEINHGLWMAGC